MDYQILNLLFRCNKLEMKFAKKLRKMKLCPTGINEKSTNTNGIRGFLVAGMGLAARCAEAARRLIVFAFGERWFKSR